MQEPAPKGIKPVEKIAEELNRMGHPSTPQSVSGDHSSVLEGVGEAVNDAGDFIGTTAEEWRGGATHIRHAPGKKPLSIARIRDALKNKLLRKKAA